MYSKAFILLCLSLLFWSCQKVEKTPKPDNLISEDKMVEVLIDLAKVDAAISLSAKEYEKREVKARDLIFEKYDIDSAQLVNSNAYYSENFRINQRIYEKVESRLKAENDSVIKRNERREEEKRTKRAASDTQHKE